MPRWQTSPGEAPWYIEEVMKPWPAAMERDDAAVRAALAIDLPDLDLGT